MKKVYLYDSEGYEADSSFAYNGIMPHNATRTKPLGAKEGYICRFDGEKWEYIENHKGEYGYVENEYIEIKEYGTLPANFTKEPVYSFDEIKKQKIMLFESTFAEIDRRKARPASAISEAMAIGEEPSYADVNMIGQLNMISEENRILRENLELATTKEEADAIEPWLPWQLS